MRVAVIGAGKIGGTVAAALAGAGHQVTVRGRRPIDDLRRRTDWAEVVVLAVPYHAIFELPADLLDGRTVLDATNYWPHRDGEDPELMTGRVTSSERVRDHFGILELTKAFNSTKWELLRDRARAGGAIDRIGHAFAADDGPARLAAARLIDDAGFDPVDLGPLVTGGVLLQPGGALHGVVAPAAELRSQHN